jgi:hypothetical protein
VREKRHDVRFLTYTLSVTKKRQRAVDEVVAEIRSGEVAKGTDFVVKAADAQPSALVRKNRDGINELIFRALYREGRTRPRRTTA